MSEKIVVQPLDDLMATLDIPRVDFMKLDVEGFEQSVITGATRTISQFKPVVMLELNHWCLNALQRTSVPDFLDFLRAIFPVLVAVEGDRYADLHNNDESYMVMLSPYRPLRVHRNRRQFQPGSSRNFLQELSARAV